MKTQELNRFTLQRLQEAVSAQLWASNAVKVNLEQPFKLASGNFSPIYVNCRQVLTSPLIMDMFSVAARGLLNAEQADFNIIAGGETAGIPYASFLGARLGKGIAYVRKATKDYGIANLVEGGNVKGQKVILVEDLITDAGSKLHFINALRNAEATVEFVLVLFDREQGGAETLAKQNVKLLAVSNLSTTLRIAKETGIISENNLIEITNYLSNPQGWHNERNLTFNK